jgi:hypothetical protein
VLVYLLDDVQDVKGMVIQSGLRAFGEDYHLLYKDIYLSQLLIGWT